MTEPTNREQRRAAERGKDDPGQSEPQAEQQQRKLIDANTPPDVTSARAKSSRHGKSTAEKWNQ
jgi:hypothetical protein